MPEKISARTRLVYLLEILTIYTDEHHQLTAEEICNKMQEYGYEINKRTVLSDIKELNKLPLQIICPDSRRKGFCLINNYSEMALHLILECVLTSDHLSQVDIREIFTYLRTHSCVPTLDLAQNTAEMLSPIVERAHYSVETLHTLRVAIDENRQVTLTVSLLSPGKVFSTGNGTENITVNPLKITTTTDTIALTFTTADDPNTPKFIHLRRIVAAQLLEWRRQPYSGPTNAPISFFNGSPLQAANRRAEWLLLRFPTSLVDSVEAHFESTVNFKQDEDPAFCLAKVQTVLDESLAGWLLLMGGAVEVLRPKYVKDAIAAAVERYTAAK